MLTLNHISVNCVTVPFVYTTGIKSLDLVHFLFETSKFLLDRTCFELQKKYQEIHALKAIFMHSDSFMKNAMSTFVPKQTG